MQNRPNGVVSVEMTDQGGSSPRTTASIKAKQLSTNSSIGFYWNRHIIKKQDHGLVSKTSAKAKIYNFLERPQGFKCILYHCAVFILVLTCLVFSVLATIEELEAFANITVFWMEILFVFYFSLEYILRVWAAGCRGKYLGVWGRIRFMQKPICMIDLIVIVASTVVLFLGTSGQVFAASAIRGIRFLQILRMLRVDRQGGTWRLLGDVIFSHKLELITTLYIGFLGLVFSSYFVYLAEKDVPGEDGQEDFGNYADALWWGVATYTTIGYGDKVPRTWAGRAVTCFFSLVIISFITLPSGILGSGFALKVQQKQRQKHFNRQFPAAAILIQSTWRSFAAEKTFSSVATWNIHIRKSKYVTPSKKKLSVYLRKKQRSKSENSTPDLRKKVNEKRLSGSNFDTTNTTAFNDEVFVNEGFVVSTPTLSANDRSFSGSLKQLADALVTPDTTGDELDEEIDNQPITVLTETHRNAIRAVRKMKFLAAKRKFIQAKKPYDVQDVIEQYSQGHLNMMFRIKELQTRLERILGKPPQFNVADAAPKPMTIGARILRLEHKFFTAAPPFFERSLAEVELPKNYRIYYSAFEDVHKATLITVLAALDKKMDTILSLINGSNR